MGKLLDELLKEIPNSDTTVQVKEICNRIWEEEKEKVTHKKTLPEGANILIALQVEPRTKGEISYVTLERDPLEDFIVCYYSIKMKEYQMAQNIPVMPKRVKAHTINEHKPAKIMGEFAKLVKFYRGE
jgi:hypothetical protein